MDALDLLLTDLEFETPEDENLDEEEMHELNIRTQAQWLKKVNKYRFVVERVLANEVEAEYGDVAKERLKKCRSVIITEPIKYMYFSDV